MVRFKESSHPVAMFLEWAEQRSELELEFSEYVYAPRSLVDRRRLFRLPARDLSVSWLDQKLSSLTPDWELALHSRVYEGEDVWHIPMMDFVSFGPDAREALARIFAPRFVESMRIFASGRSFHGYSLDLLDPDAWRVFMGTLLLCNLPERRPVVDHRWIGHRLIAGYGALRWSCNTGTYLEYPQLVGSADTRGDMTTK